MSSSESTRGGAEPLRRLWIFTKPAVPGRVKTRLTARLAPEVAARLHAAFLADTASALRGFAPAFAWALQRDEEPPRVLPIDAGLDAPLESVRQVEGDLGTRLEAVLFRGASGDRPAATVIVGSDHPELRAETIEQAFRALERHDAVLGPSTDGGFYAIGVRAGLTGPAGPAGPADPTESTEPTAPALLTGIPWSTATVFDETAARFEAHGYSVHHLAPLDDIDTPSDLDALRQRLAAAPTRHCRHTRRVLADLDSQPRTV